MRELVHISEIGEGCRRGVMYCCRKVKLFSHCKLERGSHAVQGCIPVPFAHAQRVIRSSTASTKHSSGVRFPPRRLPAPRTNSPLAPAPFRRNAVSRSSSPSNGPNSRPCVSKTLARVLRSIASSTCLRSTLPLFRNPLFVLR